jgi:DNA replication and repair protein RecF
MALTTLQLIDFRSYRNRELTLNPAVTVVVGPNASGKTNLLESLFVLSTTRSFRASDSDLIRFGANLFRIIARDNDVEYSLGYLNDGSHSEKKLARNGIKRTISNHIGALPSVLFEPTDLNLLAGPPEQRRKYLDFILCQTDATYMKQLSRYRRVLKQRNNLLSNFDIGGVQEQVFTWDVQLTEAAADIVERRKELLTHINEIVPSQYGRIAGRDEEFILTYQASVDADNYAEQFLDLLTRNLTRDLAAGFTTIGPHREDFKVKFKNNDLMSVASRGEVRTAVLAMKLAEIRYSEDKVQRKPLLLLDDVFSELDRERRIQLLGELKDYQTVITTTEADSIKGDIETDYSLIETLKEDA